MLQYSLFCEYFFPSEMDIGVVWCGLLHRVFGSHILIQPHLPPPMKLRLPPLAVGLSLSLVLSLSPAYLAGH